MQCQAHSRAPIETFKVVNVKEWDDPKGGHQGPCGSHSNASVSHVKPAESEWKDDGHESVHCDDCQCEDGQLTAEGGQESCELAERAVSPVHVIDAVDSSVSQVYRSNDQQVETHQQVPYGQVSD